MASQDPRERFVTALIAAGEIHGRKLSKEQIGLYWEVLKRYPVDEVLDAFGRHLSDPDVGQYMPKPADIVRQIDGSTETRALTAWAKVERAIRCVGAWRSVAFDDPKIHATIEGMGGWLKLCATTTEELPFRAREFEKRYRATRDGAPFPARLIGRADQHNAAHGQPCGDTVALIGNADAAREVLRLGQDGASAAQITHVRDALDVLAPRLTDQRA